MTGVAATVPSRVVKIAANPLVAEISRRPRLVRSEKGFAAGALLLDFGGCAGVDSSSSSSVAETASDGSPLDGNSFRTPTTVKAVDKRVK